MADDTANQGEEADTAPVRKDLPPAALRALAEAEERRRLAAEKAADARPKEYHGQADQSQPVTVTGKKAGSFPISSR